MSQPDTLLLLEPGFADPNHPGERFVCPDCNPIEGLLASDPERARQLTIKRLPFPRPRQAVIDALDDQHQGLPVLIFGDAAPAPADAQQAAGKFFVTNTPRILALLAERHGFPRLH